MPFSLAKPPFSDIQIKGISLGCRKWGCNKWGLKGCLPSLPGNRPKSAFSPISCLFRPCCSEAPDNTWKIQISGGKGPFFPRYPQISLNPHLLNPHLRHSKKSFQNFSHFSAIFRTFSEFSPQDFPLQNKGFELKGNKREEKIIKRTGQIDVAR